MKKLKLAMLGFGNAGQAFAALLLNKRSEIKEKFDADVQVTAIATASKGTLMDGEGINLTEILIELNKSGCFSPETKGYCVLNTTQILETAEYDVAVELTPLDIHTGQPAMDYIEYALSQGKHVISANKGPLAHGALHLKGHARRSGVHYLHETTVMDGTPVFNLVEETLPFCRITEIQGILNSTTNFLLDEMAAGNTYEAAMEEGRKRGFVEADPSLDIDGWDASAKLTALMNVLMDTDIRPSDIHRTGIAGITPADIALAAERGNVIKLLCRGHFKDGEPVGTVEPVELERSHPYAAISGTSSIVTLHTDLMGAVTIIEHDPEIEQTGYGIFSDLIRLIRRINQAVSS